MIVALVFFVLLTITLSIVLFFSLKLNLQYSEKFEEIKERTEESLDVLDTCYQRAAAKAQLDIMSDEPVVQEFVSDIKLSRDAILLVANLIVEPFQGDDEEKGLI